MPMTVKGLIPLFVEYSEPLLGVGWKTLYCPRNMYLCIDLCLYSLYVLP